MLSKIIVKLKAFLYTRIWGRYMPKTFRGGPDPCWGLRPCWRLRLSYRALLRRAHAEVEPSVEADSPAGSQRYK